MFVLISLLIATVVGGTPVGISVCTNEVEVTPPTLVMIIHSLVFIYADKDYDIQTEEGTYLLETSYIVSVPPEMQMETNPEHLAPFDRIHKVILQPDGDDRARVVFKYTIDREEYFPASEYAIKNPRLDCRLECDESDDCSTECRRIRTPQRILKGERLGFLDVIDNRYQVTLATNPDCTI